ncbi:MAG: hypothetical protein A2Z99_06320 [Treponema sp. GWB1_62_6]|nr:MAG: hypothetical protein A2Y36_14855 [Treponema sp. GWA1_62_8]OHE66432.1 MAG: hypothetical protein A2Z99_06320 [Treponema sp. GWB1_62_6]OHE67710.1 MAG: hypothetical protein A2001_19540 [Treponema sp. GWC1_61_84]OHE71857.1 MAG: hypothetical protein A2413_20805 [Treponema sp. RIFOXYC1_FULL_61_9]HCM29037.1 hypothetical protein [Treponema sp.]
MPKKKRKNWILLGSALVAAYLILASRPVRTETVLIPAWIRDLRSASADAEAADPLIPFRNGATMGYFDIEGLFSIVRAAGGNTALSDTAWSAYEAVPDGVAIFDPHGLPVAKTAERGYPWFADGRTFMVGPEQNSIAAIDPAGTVAWNRDFTSQITCADAAGGSLIVGLLDGGIQVLDAKGSVVFAFEPGGSRLPVILAAKLSDDGNAIALVSGIDPQRFLYLEKSGGSFKVAHHEYLGGAFRRPVKTAFVGGGKWVVFERDDSLGVYEPSTRRSYVLDIGAPVAALDGTGDDGMMFLLTAKGEDKALVAIRMPDEIFARASFRSEVSFLRRFGNRLFIGGDSRISAISISSR